MTEAQTRPEAVLLSWTDLHAPGHTAMMAWFALSVLMLHNHGPAIGQAFPERDDAMRLVTMMNWLAEASWFDMMELRVNPPAGLTICCAILLSLGLAGRFALLATAFGLLFSAGRFIAPYSSKIVSRAAVMMVCCLSFVSPSHARPSMITGVTSRSADMPTGPRPPTPAQSLPPWLPPAICRERSCLPEDVVMADPDMGLVILAATDHSGVAAPYHRSRRGIEDAVFFWNATPEAVRTLLRQPGAAYAIGCLGSGAPLGRERFGTDVLAGSIPIWLVRTIDIDRPIQSFRVSTP
jgi:hypothetical protein